ncbi:MAG: NADH-quinone oxidoreductase subunit M [Planctomycetaceae bacterium]|nr:NADH-quinone oxidoreductase subunit M [Planctomycetaceae bacterium]
MFDPLILLSLIVFLPAAGAIVLAIVPFKDDVIRYITLAVTIAVLVVSVIGFFGIGDTQFNTAQASMQSVFNKSWIPSFNIYYFMGIDGISLPLIMLTAVVSVLAMGASWSIKKQVKGYCILFLLLETGMLGVFLALDFFLFYVFWEVMLLPMYFLIGVWGGPRREYAAIKFFLYTLVGSVLMLIAILMIYFHSDLRQVVAISDLVNDSNEAAVTWDELQIAEKSAAVAGITIAAADPQRPDAALMLVRTGDDLSTSLQVKFVVEPSSETPTEGEAAVGAAIVGENGIVVALPANAKTAADAARVINESVDVNSLLRARAVSGGGEIQASDSITLPAADKPARTFNLLALAAIGQHTDLFDAKLLFGWSLQVWAFVLLFIGFAIKVPLIPVHTWLPDAHVEAPTPISMILAGVLLKMGGYGIIRICYPICPAGGYALTGFVCTLGVASMVYGAFAAMAQTDFKRLVAYSSVSHMGYVVLGLGVWSARDYGLYNSDYWNMGVQGAMFQMIAHGISSTGMFFMVGVIYDRVHHRNLNEFGGLFSKMPVYTSLAVIIFFAGLGLPGLCGFPGEFFVVLSVFQYSALIAVISAAVVILTAGYILWSIQRVYLGAEYKGPHEEALVPATLRENAIATIIAVLAILLGVLPYHTVLRYMDSTITEQVEDLSAWTKRHELTLAESDGADSQDEEPAPTEHIGGVDPTANKLSASPGTASTSSRLSFRVGRSESRQDFWSIPGRAEALSELRYPKTELRRNTRARPQTEFIAVNDEALSTAEANP